MIKHLKVFLPAPSIVRHSSSKWLPHGVPGRFVAKGVCLRSSRSAMPSTLEGNKPRRQRKRQSSMA